jgi:hypothetical protein
LGVFAVQVSIPGKYSVENITFGFDIAFLWLILDEYIVPSELCNDPEVATLKAVSCFAVSGMADRARRGRGAPSRASFREGVFMCSSISHLLSQSSSIV